VIVQALDEGEHEVLRALTDLNGNVPKSDLRPGLYRVIATSPYGLWETEVREFLVKGEPDKDVVLKVRPMPTHGNGDITTVRTSWANLHILRLDGQPASEARVLARDDKATRSLERWYKTDKEGKARIELTTEPLVLIITFEDILVTTGVTGKNLNPIVHLPRN